ncbi:MAG: CoA transferase [Rhodospirillaceae bacterium]|nr:CoA transferase [Alphaproteobacteria bacterium]MBR72964.1 CoA transferase [Rhodospirillaceae bacterium]|tara:strand:- start:272 stop:1522 length:1251 start_codon:yes stop_codon:yes gene_type:complete
MLNKEQVSNRTGPLSNLKVLDMSRVLAGPWCAQLLADFGADVVKVERPETGDDTRSWGPPFVKNSKGEETGDAAYFMSANRAKRSITIDLSKSEGQKVVRDLATQADILIENYKVGGLKKYQLDYDSIYHVNKRLIYCSITGFGQTGPYSERAGYDLIIQGAGGLMSITGVPDGKPGAGPQKVGVAVSDLMTGMYAITAILAALNWRQLTGEGQHIDLALLDTQASWLSTQAMNYLVGGQSPERFGNEHVNIVPYGVFPTKDGHMILGIGNNGQLRKFLEIAGKSDLLEDSRFRDHKSRIENREFVNEHIRELTKTKTMDDWIAKLDIAGVPCGPINTLDRVFGDPQILARNMRVNIPHSSGVSLDHPGNPIKFSKSPVDYPSAAPQLGEHTKIILKDWVDYDDNTIESLLKNGIT